MMKKNYSLKESLFQRHISRKKESLYRWLTKDSLPLFLRGKDEISIHPQVYGYHEVRIKKLMAFAVENGQSDFLVDIGANIGLSTCQSGDLFKEVHCFEPNPDCFDILKVNTSIALKNAKLFLYKIGLGSDTKTLKLVVPKHNWGGAFVYDENNTYSTELLASKDGFNSFEWSNYNVVDIAIESANEVFKNLFSGLSARGLKKGFVKIDVEGYEPVVISALASQLPKDFEITIVFESFDRAINIESVKESFSGSAEALQLVRTPEKREGLLARIGKIITQRGYVWRFMAYDEKCKASDIVLIISNQNVTN
jgi:FkbM family methyltransferase